MTRTLIPAGEPRASVVVLAKDTRLAKTRLEIPREEARQVALTLAGSTVRAVLASETVGAVYVVTGDVEIAQDAREAGADVIAEPRPLGMNRAAELGRSHALRTRPMSPVVIMVADLAAVRAGDIDAVIREHHHVGLPLYVADHEGTGTTVLIHGPAQRPGIGFGGSSAALHRGLGYRPAAGSGASLRHDLDTPEDLAAHRAMNVTTAS